MSLGYLLEAGSHEFNEVNKSRGVAPLVVVPRDDLDAVAHHGGQTGVENCRVRVGHDVRRDQWIGRVLKVFAQGTFSSCLLECCVDFFHGCGASQVDGQVSGRTGWNWYAHSVTVQLTLELWEHHADGLGGTGGGRDDVQCCGAGTAWVAVRCVLQALVCGVSVDGGHQAINNAELFVQYLGYWSQAVGGA